MQNMATAGAFLGVSLFHLWKKKGKESDSSSAQDMNVGKAFDELFAKICSEFVADVRSKYSLSDSACARIQRMFEYTAQGGKCYRGHLTVSAARELCKHRKLDFAKFEVQAMVLGWGIEILQACFLVADDIMDGSTTRRGKPCWYKDPTVQLDAVNDSLILESWIYFLIKQYFPAGAKRSALVEVFQQVSLETQLGQMLDLTSQPQGQKGSKILKNFNLKMYKQIVTYKTACYTFYLPLACAIILTGEAGKSQEKELQTARDICIELGEKFQIQDDFLDCYGKPEMIGKIGTDIQDHKCSWLCVQALKRMNAAQRQNFEKWYGKEDEESVANVKALFTALKLPELYEQQEADSFARIQSKIAAATACLPAAVFLPILHKIHKRQK